MFNIVFSEGEQARSAADRAAADASSASGADALALVGNGMPGSCSAPAASLLGSVFTGHVNAWTAALRSYAQSMGSSLQDFSALDAVRADAFQQAACHPSGGAGS